MRHEVAQTGGRVRRLAKSSTRGRSSLRAVHLHPGEKRVLPLAESVVFRSYSRDVASEGPENQGEVRVDLLQRPKALKKRRDDVEAVRRVSGVPRARGKGVNMPIWQNVKIPTVKMKYSDRSISQRVNLSTSQEVKMSN